MSEISAGAIVYTKKDEILYLVIKDFHDNYGFPKGHLEAGETAEAAAVREIREEAGIAITLDTGFCEQLHYIMPNGIAKTAIYYLGTYMSQQAVPQEEEVQEIRLLPYDEALNILTFPAMKEVLRKADKYIHEKQRTVTDA